jgi:hypothetical protein
MTLAVRRIPFGGWTLVWIGSFDGEEDALAVGYLHKWTLVYLEWLLGKRGTNLWTILAERMKIYVTCLGSLALIVTFA